MGLPNSPLDLLECPAAAAGFATADSTHASGADGGSSSTSGSSGCVGRTATSSGDRWAVAELAASGEEPLGRLYLPQYLLLALAILMPPLGERNVNLKLFHHQMRPCGGCTGGST